MHFLENVKAYVSHSVRTVQRQRGPKISSALKMPLKLGKNSQGDWRSSAEIQTTSFQYRMADFERHQIAEMGAGS